MPIAGGLELDSLEGLLQPKQFYDLMILFCKLSVLLSLCGFLSVRNAEELMIQGILAESKNAADDKFCFCVFERI